MLTYDDVPLVRGLYPPDWCEEFGMSYSAARAYRGQEIMVFSENTIRDTRPRTRIAVGKAFSSWLEKLVEAFMRTVLPDPEKTGEQLGSWVLSYLGVKHK